MRSALKSLLNRYDATSRWLHGSSIIRNEVSFLHSSGWFRSAKEQMSVDKDGNPIPWLSYAAIHFLAERLKVTMSLFEYGSGNSTLYWASRVGHVVSCEHDPQWYSIMKDQLPSNVDYIQRSLDGGAYAESILETGKTYDVIVIDGRQRNRCAGNAIECLTDVGIIIWDNSERPRYADGIKRCTDRGFRRIDFCGPLPITMISNSTTILYRDKNVFDI